MDKYFDIFYGKDTQAGYNMSLELLELSKKSNEMYAYMNKYIEMLDNENSFIRVRSFKLICSQAKWDKKNIINKNIGHILLELDDEKPTAVRQCLAALNILLTYKPELFKDVKKKLEKIDYSKYKDTMRPLIQKDIANILKSNLK